LRETGIVWVAIRGRASVASARVVISSRAACPLLYDVPSLDVNLLLAVTSDPLLRSTGIRCYKHAICNWVTGRIWIAFAVRAT